MAFRVNPFTGLLDYVNGIGSPIAGGTANCVLYLDSSGNIACDTDFTFDGSKVNLDALQFDIAATPLTNAEGLLQWNATDGTLDLGMSGGDVTMQIGQEMFMKVRNVSGSTIANGTPVYLSGRTGNRPNIYPARSDSDTTSGVIGITTQDITSPSDGFVTIVGYVRQIKTDYSGSGNWGTTWSAGDNLYVSKTVAGQLTNVEPTAPHHSDIVGTVEIVGGLGIGSILVNLTKHKTMAELTDVNGTALTTTGQLPVWNQTAGYFDFDYNLTDYAKMAAKPLTDGSVLFANSSGLVAQDNTNFRFADSTNILTVSGGIVTPKIYPASDSTTAFQINKADGTTNVLNVDTTNGSLNLRGLSYYKLADIFTNGTGWLTGYNLKVSAGAPVHDTVGTMSGVFYGSDAIHFYANTSQVGGTAASEKMTLLNSGYFGIGTASPQRTLHVNGAIRVGASIEFMNGATINSYLGAYDQIFGGTSTDFGYYIVNGACRFMVNSSTIESGRIASNRYWSIGDAYASPTERLSIYNGHLGFRTLTRPSAPSGVAVGSGGSMPASSTTRYEVSYVTASGETNLSLASANITTVANDSVTVTIPVSTSLEVTQRKLYRNTVANPNGYFLVDTIANNSATTYLDTKADASLGTAESSSKDNTTSGVFYLDGSISGGVTGNSVWFGIASLPLAHTSVGLTYIGASAGNKITTAGYATGIGQTTQYNNRTASYTTTCGAYALYGSGGTDLGAYNCAFGAFTGYYADQDAIANSIFGIFAMQNLTKGSHNIAMGYTSGYNNTIGSGNFFMGYGSGNSVLGAGYESVTDAYCGYFGYQTGRSVSSGTTLTNAWAMGHQAMVGQSNTLCIGTNSSYSMRVGIGPANYAPYTTLHVISQATLDAFTDISSLTNIRANGFFQTTVNDASYGVVCGLRSSVLSYPTASANTNNTFALYGINDTYNNSYNINAVQGVVATSRHQGTGTLAVHRGGNIAAANLNTGTVTTEHSLILTTTNSAAGTVTTAYGLGTNISNAGASSVMTTAYGNAVQSFSNVGTMTDAYLGYFGGFTNSGTITNTYGVYVGDITSGTQTNTPFSIYASDANTFTYIAGKVGIKNTAPAVELDIMGVGSSDEMRLGQDRTNYYKIGRNTSTGFLDITGTQADPYRGLLTNGGFIVNNTNTFQVDYTADTFWTGDSSGLPYGSCWGNEIGWSQASAAQNTWYAISDADMSDGELNLVTHDGSGKLTVSKAGRYLINWSWSGDCDTVGKHVQIGILVSGTANNAGMNHFYTATAAQEYTAAGTAIIDLAASAYIEVGMRTTDTGTPTLSCDHLNITLTMVGGT
jgi:hypothetical protein